MTRVYLHLEGEGSGFSTKRGVNPPGEGGIIRLYKISEKSNEIEKILVEEVS